MPYFQPSSGVVKFANLAPGGVPGSWIVIAEESDDCAEEGALEIVLSVTVIISVVVLVSGGCVVELVICEEVNDEIFVAEDAASKMLKSISEPRVIECIFSVNLLVIKGTVVKVMIGFERKKYWL